MITEDYISYETAKLLVKKNFGYNAEYASYYTLHGEIVYFKDNPKVINIAPRITIQMVMKWLRNEYNIDIIVFPHKRKRKTYYARVLRDFYIEHQQKCNVYVSHEEAAEAAIKYCLENLI